MDSNSKYSNSLTRHLSTLKLVSRLLGHELHSQGGAKSITLSRDEVVEMQTSIDIFIEEVGRGGRGNGTGMAGITSTTDVELVPARN
ncbi:MAG: hypothetical protein ACI8QZ_001759 [Chlamydiales bacterium]|jgi:hypothetical protein